MTGVLSVPGPRRTAATACGDHELVQRVREGDDRAFEVLFERYSERITAYVRGMVRDHGRAEDITQEVFINALRRMRETDRSIAFRPWVYEIAKNACIDAHRRTRRTQEVSYDADEGLGPADQGRLVSPRAVADTVETRESFENLQGALGALSESHADVLVLRELEGLSYKEIGDRLGMSQGAVESTLFRARKRLEAEYGELVSGERCRQIQESFAEGARPRLRDRRRISRHLAWCQGCRHQARLAGLDIEVAERVALRKKVGALLPIPAFIRERLIRSVTPGARYAGGAGDQLAEWARAVAATVAVAIVGVGAGTIARNAPVVDAHGYTPDPALYEGGGADAGPPVLRELAGLVGSERGLRGGTTDEAGLPGVPGAAGTLGAPVSAGPLAPALPAAGAPAGTPSQPGAPGTVGAVAAGLGGTVGGLAGTTGGGVRGLTNTVGGTVRDATGTVGGAVRDATGTVGGTVRGTTGTVGGLVRDVTRNPTDVDGAVDNAVRRTTGTVQGTVRGTTDTVSNAVGGVSRTVDSTVRGTTGTVDEAVQGTTGTVQQTVREVTQTTTGVVGGVVDSVTPTGQAAPAPAPAPTTAAPAPAQQGSGTVGQVVQDTTGALGDLLEGR
jgi:RNA polymerase sigma factor (sigma-70 family)